MRVARVLFLRWSVLAALCVAGGSQSVFGQVAGGEITGVVKDQGGVPTPGATITVTDVRTGRLRVVTSTADGLYVAPGLVPGEYRVDVELSGFKAARREPIRVFTGEKVRVDVDLAVGDFREQVTVTGMRRSSAPRLPASGPSWDRSRSCSCR